MNLNIYLYIFVPITFINIYVQVSGESTILMTCNLYEVRGVFTLSFHHIFCGLQEVSGLQLFVMSQIPRAGSQGFIKN